MTAAEFAASFFFFTVSPPLVVDSPGWSIPSKPERGFRDSLEQFENRQGK
jgi:hypothetical protein